jgi:hypothetical protein
MKSRARSLLDKSLDAMLAAIEIYNKPRFPYRDEAFSVLAINAWELLLKARLLQLGNNKLGVIIAKEQRRNADGSLSTQRYIKRNRSGNAMSIGMFKALDRIGTDFGETIPDAVRDNLDAMCEIRDNSVHFMNDAPDTEIRVNEIGSATAKNYLNLSRQWFGVDFAQYNLSLLPLAFMRGFRTASGISVSKEEERFVKFVTELSANDDVDADFNVALHIEVQMKRTKDSSGAKFTISKDADAIPIQIDEENIRETYPWDYNILTTRLKKRYSNFKVNRSYHTLRKSLENDSRFANERVLDPGNPRSARKTFFNPNIFTEFDQHYERP